MYFLKNSVLISISWCIIDTLFTIYLVLFGYILRLLGKMHK
jgi:hypothetical protein